MKRLRLREEPDKALSTFKHDLKKEVLPEIFVS